MARILLAWELGGDYGHLMRFLTLAHALADRGHEPVIALRELTHVDSVWGAAPFPVYQAPVWMASVGGLPPATGFAETLMRLGFLHPPSLAGLIRAWQALVALLNPDLLIFDYAPTGLLATRGLGVPRIQFGASFSIPPPAEPMPVYRWWQPADKARMIESERLVLRCANAALARVGQPAMRCLADLVDSEEVMITSLPELDQYPNRSGGRYWGDIANLTRGVAPSWPIVGAQRVFAYLKPHFKDIGTMLQAFTRADAAFVVHAPGISPAAVRQYTSANVSFSDEPVRMQEVLENCDLIVCHAGASTVEAALMAGKPLLLLPQHLEQMMTAKRVEALGAGLWVNPERPAPDYGKLLARLLSEAGFRHAAKSMASRHAGHDPVARLAAIIDRCEEVAAGAVRKHSLVGAASPATRESAP